MFSNATFIEATVRAFVGAVVMAGVSFCAVLPTADDPKVIIASTGGSFFGFLAIRMGIEGTLDARRAARGDVKPADVGSDQPPIIPA